MEPEDEDNLAHIGIKRRSGRYPWGSGDNPYQRSVLFKGWLSEARAKGLSDTEIAQSMGISTTQLRANIGVSTSLIFNANRAMAQRLKNEKQYSTRAIAKRMLGDESKESTVRGWLKASEEIKDNAIESITSKIKNKLVQFGWIDVGSGTEHYLGVSETRLKTSLASLEDEGYKIHPIKVRQLGTDKFTQLKVLGPEGSTWKEAKAAVDSGQVYTIKDTSPDGGLTFLTPKAEPVSVNSKRIEVRYGDEGGSEMDGVIEIRPGVQDLYMGANRYAQVRVAVDGTHYLKGMAIYADDLPAGTDIRFNTNKTRAQAPTKVDVMKPLKEGAENAGHLRFGAQIKPKPLVYVGEDGKEHTSAINLVNEEGDWDSWSRSLSSQVLSKQSVSLANAQLNQARVEKQKELSEIMALTNPIVKRQLLLDFAQSADSAAIHLKAAALPRQSSHVILPMNSMRPNEVYAPNFNDGEKVALIRYPHGGPFEIPQLTVNNKNRTAKKIMGGATDAIGVHHSVAQQLSGADFDGDTVLVIPNDSGKIKSRPYLDELKDFDPKMAYPEGEGMTYMTPANTQKEMGKISNLITDMTIKGAESSEIARAVKHSMVVIDAEKHKLDYKLSEKENGIAQLKAKYQDGSNKGAATIISRSGAQASVPQRRLRRQSEGGPIDPTTGELVYVPTADPPKARTITRVNQRTGAVTTKVEPLVTRGTKGEFTKDAHDLVSVPGEPIERTYANYANSMKELANTARKEAVAIKDPPQSPAAKAYYAQEVASLKNKLKEAQMNAPLERRAQIVGNATAKARIETRPDLDKDEIRKIQYQSLADARIQTGAAKQRIGGKNVPFTQREWDAVQAGAIASTTLKKILQNSEMDTIKKLATPRPSGTTLTTGQLARIKSLRSAGRSLTEISAELGIPRSTVADHAKGT